MSHPSNGFEGQTSVCMDKMKSGFLYGSSLGLAGGILLGAFNCLRHGARGKELIGIMTKNLILCSGSFGSLVATIVGIQNCYDTQDLPKPVFLHPVESTNWNGAESLPIRAEDASRPDSNVGGIIAAEPN